MGMSMSVGMGMGGGADPKPGAMTGSSVGMGVGIGGPGQPTAARQIGGMATDRGGVMGISEDPGSRIGAMGEGPRMEAWTGAWAGAGVGAGVGAETGLGLATKTGEMWKMKVSVPETEQRIVPIHPEASILSLIKAIQNRVSVQSVVVAIHSSGYLLSLHDKVCEVLNNGDVVTAKICPESDISFSVFFALNAPKNSKEIEAALGKLTGSDTDEVNLSQANLGEEHVMSLLCLKDHPYFRPASRWTGRFPRKWNLAHNDLGSGNSTALCEFVKTFSEELTYLDISFCGISEGADRLLDCIGETKIETVCLSGNSLQPASMESLPSYVSALERFLVEHQVREISLNSCLLASTGLPTLLPHQPNRKHPKKLRLRDNKLGSIAASKIVTTLFGSLSFIELDLSNTNLYEDEVKEEEDVFAEAMRALLIEKQLTVLSLSSNKLSPRLLDSLFPSCITRLDLSGTNLASERLFEVFCECLITDGALLHIDLSKICFSEAQVKLLCDSLTTSGVRSINLSACKFEAGGVQIALRLISAALFVQHLDLSGNISQAGTETKNRLVTLAPDFKPQSLLTLDLSDNSFTEKEEEFLERKWKATHPQGGALKAPGTLLLKSSMC
jgi:hypothetical protein